jgi:hypothetical protein
MVPSKMSGDIAVCDVSATRRVPHLYVGNIIRPAAAPRDVAVRCPDTPIPVSSRVKSAQHVAARKNHVHANQ